MNTSEQIDLDRKFLEVIVPYGPAFVKAAKDNNWEEAARLQSEALQRLTKIVEEATKDGARRASLMVLNCSHNNDCLFCARKDTVANDGVNGTLLKEQQNNNVGQPNPRLSEINKEGQL